MVLVTWSAYWQGTVHLRGYLDGSGRDGIDYHAWDEILGVDEVLDLVLGALDRGDHLGVEEGQLSLPCHDEGTRSRGRNQTSIQGQAASSAGASDQSYGEGGGRVMGNIHHAIYLLSPSAVSETASRACGGH